MSRIAVVCIVLCLALWGINAAAVPRPTDQTPQGGEPSYAVDLYRPATDSTGFLDLSPIQLGNGQSTTLEIEVYPRTQSGCILSMGAPGTDNFVALQLQDGNLVVRIGAANQPNSVVSSSGSPIQANTWTTISVVITNSDASSASVTAYANGAVVINGATTRALTANLRRSVFIGRCQYREALGGNQGPQQLNGIVDNFRVWDLARSLADIQAFASLISTTVDLDNPAGLIVHFPFVEGVGSSSVGYAGQVANNFHVASFANDALWVVKNAGTIHRICTSAGDPHVAIHVPGQGSIHFDPPHVIGYWQLTSCGNNFIVRTFHAPVRSWELGEGCESNVCGATINNAFTVRAYDDVFFVSKEGSFFIKKLFATTYSNLPVGSGVRDSGTRYNFQSRNVFIEVPAAGYLRADLHGLGRGGTFANIYVYHTLACETLGVSGLCANQNQRITENQFLFFDNATPLPEPGEVPPRNFDPCDNLPAALRAVLEPQAEAACASTIDKDAFPTAYDDCVFDVCASGDISVVTNINDDGACRLAEILAAQSGQTVPACTTRAQCPNSCSGHGTCTPTGCSCSSGYVGPDCARPAQFPCFGVNNGNELPLSPWVFQTSIIGTIPESDFFTFWNTWHTEDGILIYFAKVEASQSVFSYNLFVSNDAPNSDGGSYTLRITSPAAWYTDATPQGTGVNVQSTGTDTVVSFTWEAFRANGIIFKNVDTSVARTLTVQITGDSGIRQVSVGANSLRAELDVLAVDRDFTLTAGNCVDDCAIEDDCEACAAKPQCGWCRSSGQCFLGGPSGPRAATCKDWKFSTDALVARRLTASFGYPVNPDTNTAYLPVSAVNDLDIDLFVAMGNKETIKWDMALVLGSSGLTNADDRTNWLVDFGSLTNVFRLFPDLGFSLGTYNSVNNNKFTLISALVDASSVTSDVLRSWVYSIPLADANNDAATSALATLTNPSFGLNWRVNTRRMITIYVDQLPVFGTGLTPTAPELRQTLLNFRALPVFLATSNVQAAWETVVADDLGFGIVIPVQADSGDLAFAITKAINLATSQISLITDLTSEGHVIDKFAQSVTGLSSNMRARFSVPFRAESAEAKTTTLIAPGFGAATVTNVLNDSPLATIRNIKLTEDNFDIDYQFNGTVFRLAGISSNGVDPILAEVFATPIVGGLYQFDPAGPKPAKLITTTPTLVTDPQGRVIYLAPPDASNNGDNQFDEFTYRVRDACAWSDNVVVRVDVIGVNDRPWTQMAAPIGDEDVPVELNFKFFDREGDSADAYISELPYDILPSGQKVARGKLYQYSPAVLAGDLTGAVEIQANDRVIDNRAVYIGWLNSNTENKPPVLFSQPFLTYYVKETTCCADNSCKQNECTMLTSWPETIQIFLRAVNDAPVIIKDSDLANYNFTATPCFSDCTFLEDNGARFPDLAQPVHVWLGGGDIELDQLKAVITALELPATASLTDLSGNQITVGSVIGPFSAGTLKFDVGTGNWNPVGTLFPALRFTPGLDENNNVNGYYAKITYKVNDGDKDSVETKTVTIRITPVNDLPRSTIVTTYTGPVPTNQPGVLAVPHIITLMNTPANFTITGTDPESDPVTPVISSCFATGGKVELLNNNVWVAVNCSIVTTLPTKPSGSTWLFRYTPPTNVAADSLQVVTYQLRDGSNDNRVGVDDWIVTIDVIAVNQAPTLKLDNNAPTSNLVLATNVGVGLPLNYNLTLADPDVESGTMLFSASLVCLESRQENCVGRIVVTDIASGTVVTRTNTNIVIRGMIFDLQVVLRSFNFISSKMSKYNLTVTINDNGNLGVCPPAPGANTIVRFCPLQANLNAVITVDDGGAINTIVIASVAGAAAAAGIALAAGFASRLNKKAQSAQYTPWEINDMDRGISNPLHESPTVEMSNPLHEGPDAMNE